MAMAGGRFAAVAGAATVALVLGVAAGWLAARASTPPPPPPPSYVNPLADAKKGEILVLDNRDGVKDTFRVVEAMDQVVLLAVEKAPPGMPATVRQWGVARSFWGALVILGGDIDEATAESTVRDLVVRSAEPANLFVASINRTLRCWKISAKHRVWGEMSIWISDELPVHGIARIEDAKGMKCEVSGFSFGEGR